MFSRPQKLSHLDTIQYEIDMLNYCYRKLLKEKWENTPDNYISLECFLLHYRNLIEFFGDSEDLKVSEWKEWAPRELSAEELASIRNKKPFDNHRGLISQYLQHCTKGRTKDRAWDVKEMYEELRQVLENFWHLFPIRSVVQRTASLSTNDFSTATMTVCDSGLNLDQPVIRKSTK
jgi:hypothetical protein